MPYGTLLSDTVQSSTAGTPPQFNDGNGAQVGTLCRAWVNFNGTTTTPTIRASFNTSSVTKVSAGDYDVAFSKTMPDANYSAVAASSMNSGATNNPNMLICPGDNVWDATKVRVRIYTSGSYLTEDILMVSVSVFR